MKTQDIKELDVNKITNEIIDTISSHYEKEIKILHKALELACERIKNMYEQEQQYCTNEIENFVKVEYDYFIKQAKEKANVKN